MYIQKRQLDMTPEEYIKKLREVQCTLDSMKNDLDFAVHRMVRRIETGDESMGRGSRRVTLAVREYAKLIVDQLLEIATAKIVY